MKELFINLQLFADAGTLVNATGNYVNAYTGDTTAFDTSHTLSPVMKTFYDTEMLENARPELFYSQFARKQGLPANRGKTVEWRKWNKLPDASVLSEGVIPEGQKMGETYITSTLGQYGEYVSVSDVLDLHAIDDVILGATEELGASAGITQDKLVRDEVCGGTNVIYAPTISGTTETEVTARTGIDSTAVLTAKVVNKAVTKLKKLNAPKINGKYVAIIHPSVTFDLRQNADWIDAHKYANPTEIYNGEIGELHGCRFVESTNAKVLNGADLASDSRTLAINNASGYTGAITTVAFDGGTVEADALIGRKIMINGITAEITDNTASALTFASTDFGTIADNAVIYPGEGGKEGNAVYCCMFLGKDAYGMVDPDGAGLEMIVKSKEQVGGPLNQFSTVGYKLSSSTKRLYEDRMVRVECGSSYGTADEAN